MNLKPLLQKRKYLQWLWSRGCKNIGIYNELKAADTKTQAFAMIWNPWLQKPILFFMILKPLVQSMSIHSDFEAVGTQTIVVTMSLEPLVHKQQYLQWFWTSGCKHNIIVFNEFKAIG